MKHNCMRSNMSCYCLITVMRQIVCVLTIHESQGLILPKAWIGAAINYVAISRVKKLPCVIEPMMSEMLISMKTLGTQKFRLVEETRLANLPQATCSAHRKLQNKNYLWFYTIVISYCSQQGKVPQHLNFSHLHQSALIIICS